MVRPAVQLQDNPGWNYSAYNRRMRQALDRFILGFPVLFLKQYPYAWIAAVVLWSWPPVFSGIFLVVIVVGLLMLRWQSIAWVSNLRREHAVKDGKFYVDESPFSPIPSARKIILLLLGAALIAWLLKGQLGLGFWQFFLMIVGFSLFYQDTRFFGPPATYVITDEGIGIRFVPGHLDYRLFFAYNEISRIQKTVYMKDRHGDLLARPQEPRDGLFLSPKDPNGFTRRIEKLFIVPRDVDAFVEQLPKRYQ